MEPRRGIFDAGSDDRRHGRPWGGGGGGGNGGGAAAAAGIAAAVAEASCVASACARGDEELKPCNSHSGGGHAGGIGPLASIIEVAVLGGFHPGGGPGGVVGARFAFGGGAKNFGHGGMAGASTASSWPSGEEADSGVISDMASAPSSTSSSTCGGHDAAMNNSMATGTRRPTRSSGTTATVLISAGDRSAEDRSQNAAQQQSNL